MRHQQTLTVGKFLALSVAALAALSVGSLAATIPINNPSFEMPALTCTPGPTCGVVGTISGWTVSSIGEAGYGRPTVGPGQEFTSLPDGLQIAVVGDSGGGSEIYQDLSATLAANTTYTLRFWVGMRSDYPFDPGYQVSLIANGVTLAAAGGATPALGTFVQQTLVYNSGASPAELGQTLSVDVSDPRAETGAAWFDLFALDASPMSSTPEPSSLLLVGSGALGLAGVIRRKLTL